nr:WhiB family transcriptional regulator [Serinicoccus kebangsaanensis]
MYRPARRHQQADETTGSPYLVSGGTDDLPCREHPADLWFAELPADVEQAKELCGPCPLREVCLAGALERREPWGVWGGQLLLQGRVVPRKRPRGRPRKDEVAA